MAEVETLGPRPALSPTPWVSSLCGAGAPFLLLANRRGARGELRQPELPPASEPCPGHGQ